MVCVPLRCSSTYCNRKNISPKVRIRVVYGNACGGYGVGGFDIAVAVVNADNLYAIS